MKPTMKLRFVEREVTELVDGYQAEKGFEICRKVTRRILQQWWQNPDLFEAFGIGGVAPIGEDGEWRDVPVETEDMK